MKSKNAPNRRAPERAARSPAKAKTRDTTIILDFVQSRIEAFNREQGGGVSVRKDARGYTLTRDDTGMPAAGW